jgi:YggT family protein
LQFLCTALQLYVLVIFARIILSWIPVAPGSAVETIDTFLRMLTEPVLGPLRRTIPAVRLGGMALDLSPMILVLVIQIIVLPIVCTH